ncbi:threonine--tRNA ligase [Acidimicrobiia bacterium]|jgi:threonyl-tRNA synthetase|nr:threonine--tRNA ligase [Acidimicrobiia bacterium]MDA8922655.1 threonine--tRNA ligase [Acidimicrobiia bacterium]MDA9198297.1 threonine--tRNA ligase [Acidimicrobiia bacterium]MDA9862874.1 threonine--tRNA ligase [Acidimicrobiia bacterium]MDB4855638.1 threonine--tRNA ligase [Acidimicrobiia bacterium]
MNIEITLPDKSVRTYEKAITGEEIAFDIGPKLGKDAVAIEINRELYDTSYVIKENAAIKILTKKDIQSLSILRHSSAHLLAQAVLNLYPGTLYGVGPDIEDGFYYDFLFKENISDADLPKIEKEMLKLSKANQQFTKSTQTKSNAMELFKNQQFKMELIDSADETEGVEGSKVSLYSNNEFIDLCKGPHVPNTGFIKHFKLTRLGGAYWRGDENNSQLQRIYGTSWFNKEDLEQYLTRRVEAEKRDHRKLGKQLELFTTADELGPGQFLWKPNGALLRNTIENYSKKAHINNGYDFVNTPHIGRSVLWETSGHLEHYEEGMYPPLQSKDNDDKYYLKPMNCPFHILIYKSELRSYKELPLRLFELGSVYRFEKTGVLHGLLRARGFTQDDAHIFCTFDQINTEVNNLLRFSIALLKSFGFKNIEADLSTKPNKAIGNDEDWNIATRSLEVALEDEGIDFVTAEGEGAFYGPKIDLHVKDAIGRRWQLSTIQIDFAQPDNFDLEYVSTKNSKDRPVMIHRALLGSIERFTGILIEHYAGEFPTWLAPTQLKILTIGDVSDYVKNITDKLSGVRLEIDDRNIRLGEKIHDAKKQNIPLTLIIGEKDLSNNTGSLNILNSESKNNLDIASLVDFIIDDVTEPEFEF